MKVEQMIFEQGNWQNMPCSPQFNGANTLILVFGALAQHADALSMLATRWPNALIAGATTSGEITNTCLQDQGLSATLVHFEQTQLRLYSAIVEQAETSYQVGQTLAQQLQGEHLQGVLVLSDGLKVYGSDLTKGLLSLLPANIPIMGGLAGDDFQFKQTLTLAGECLASSQVVAIGLYGQALTISHGSRGGWLPFGPKRTITGAQGHVLLSLDYEPALEVYKSYLGDLVDNLPGSGLRYPLEIEEEGKPTRLVRTMLAVDEDQGSITFAGDIPLGATARFMRANVESIIDGAADAAEVAIKQHSAPELAILISCVGRKELLRQMADEELDVVREAMGERTTICGFYSYGEIAPFECGNIAELHNQTMTITCISELSD